SFTAGQGYQVYVRTKGTTCVTSAVCEGQTAGRPGQSNTTQLSPVKLPVMDIVESELKVKAYPNPFNQRINFVVSSPVSVRGSLEVYNGMGQKVKTVYVGMISRGSQTFELTLPANKTSNLLYVLRVGNQRITGKILQLNR
ncbi:MAG TPA: T9SS type A sorting domain-containing protein, partial [Chitinophagaceae bacterium]|nr:T9SS type A sorting domain-containing protein [Chitinophagaceae bacterium]